MRCFFIAGDNQKVEILHYFLEKRNQHSFFEYGIKIKQQTSRLEYREVCRLITICRFYI